MKPKFPILKIKVLRHDLLTSALRIFSENKDNEYPQKIFEIGTIFEKDKRSKSETGINEKEHLLIACSPANFTELKKMLDYLMKMLNIEYELKESEHGRLIDGRAGAIIVNKKESGFIGEVDIETLRKRGIKMPVSVIEINLDEIFEMLG